MADPTSLDPSWICRCPGKIIYKQMQNVDALHNAFRDLTNICQTAVTCILMAGGLSLRELTNNTSGHLTLRQGFTLMPQSVEQAISVPKSTQEPCQL